MDRALGGRDVLDVGVVVALSPDYAGDGIAFVATHGELWCTADRGHRWERVVPGLSRRSRAGGGDPLVGRRVVEVSVSPWFAEDALVLVGTLDGAVARSVDSGWTWEAIAQLRGPVAGFEFPDGFEHDRQVLVSTRADGVVAVDVAVDSVAVDGPRVGTGPVAA